MNTLRPGDLYRRIRELTAQLERLSLNKAAAPLRARVNRAFNPSLKAEVLLEATFQAFPEDLT
jgi:hypothetical protein